MRGAWEMYPKVQSDNSNLGTAWDIGAQVPEFLYWVVVWNLTSSEFLDLLSGCWLIRTLPRRVKLQRLAADFARHAGCILKHSLPCLFECYIYTVRTRSRALSSVRIFRSSIKTYALRSFETSGKYSANDTASLKCYCIATGITWKLRMRFAYTWNRI
jgi:hypothetical protein